MNATISLREYLKKGKCFVVPNYQRGYVWGKKKTGGAKDSVTYMLDSIKNGYKTKTEVFIQGVTVSELPEKIILIDGQQRTTFFFLLLKSLNYGGNFKLQYDIRKKSDTFLKKQNILDDIAEVKEEEFQDIYFFKKTLRIINDEYLEQIEEKDKEKAKEQFCNYVLDNVKFLYINIPKDKATKVFTMMNGNKAEMKAEELIKAELLRLASLNDAENLKIEDKETLAVEWDNNMLRSRYAREWDKWLQWWNRDDVKKLFFRGKDSHVMGLLVETYQQSTSSPELSFENFRAEFLKKQKPIEAKKAFDGLRRLQKRFEDAFNNPITYNRIGAIIRIFDKENKDEFIKWYFLGKKRDEKELEEYYKLGFLNLSHSKITNSDESKKQEDIDTNFRKRYDELKSNNLYNDYPETAFSLLLRLNIDEDNLQEDGKGRKFDFSIWDRLDSRGRSLEHIYPKSKVYHKDEGEDGTIVIKNGNNDKVIIEKCEGGTERIKNSNDGRPYIWREDCKYKVENDEEVVASEHSIGNLVLLYKDENSQFSNSSFETKKGMFFKRATEGKEEKAIFKSRHLLHTIYKFASSKWDGEEIAKNKFETLQAFKKYYGKEQDKLHYG